MRRTGHRSEGITENKGTNAGRYHNQRNSSSYNELISTNEESVTRSRDRSRPITVPRLITIRAGSRHHNYSSQHKYLRARVTVSQIDDPGPVSRMRMRAHPGPVANPIMPRPHRPVLQSGENIWLSSSNIISSNIQET